MAGVEEYGDRPEDRRVFFQQLRGPSPAQPQYSDQSDTDYDEDRPDGYVDGEDEDQDGTEMKDLNEHPENERLLKRDGYLARESNSDQSNSWYSRRNVSFFWSEKGAIWFEYFQLFGVIWWLAVKWPFPAAWLTWTSWSLAFNLDIASWVNSSSFYTFWLFAWMALPIAIVILYFVLWLFIRASVGKGYLNAVAALMRVFFTVTEIMYIPWALHAARTVSCTNNVLTHAPGTICWSIEHLILLAVSLVSVVIMGVGLPIAMIVIIRRGLVTHRTDDHEQYLQLRETEYIVGLDNEWSTAHFHLFSSFKRRAAYHRPWRLFARLVFVFGAVLATDYLLYQAAGLIAWWTVHHVYAAVVMPYRMTTSSLIMHLMGWINILNLAFGALLAAKVQSALLVSSVLIVWLMFFNLFAIFFSLVMLVVMLYWTCTKVHVWPVTEALALERSDPDVVDAVRDARAIVTRTLACVKYFVRIDILADEIKKVGEMYERALTKNDPLKVSLLDVLEDLVNTYNSIAPVSLLPRPRLEVILPAFRIRLDARDREMALYLPSSRLFILFMMGIRAFMGHRRFQKLQLALLVYKPIINYREMSQPSRVTVPAAPRGILRGGKSATEIKNVKLEARLEASMESADSDDSEDQHNVTLNMNRIMIFDILWKRTVFGFEVEIPEGYNGRTFWVTYFDYDTTMKADRFGDFFRCKFADKIDIPKLEESGGHMRLMTAKGNLYAFSIENIVCEGLDGDAVGDDEGDDEDTQTNADSDSESASSSHPSSFRGRSRNRRSASGFLFNPDYYNEAQDTLPDDDFGQDNDWIGEELMRLGGPGDMSQSMRDSMRDSLTSQQIMSMSIRPRVASFASAEGSDHSRTSMTPRRSLVNSQLQLSLPTQGRTTRGGTPTPRKRTGTVSGTDGPPSMLRTNSSDQSLSARRGRAAPIEVSSADQSPDLRALGSRPVSPASSGGHNSQVLRSGDASPDASQLLLSTKLPSRPTTPSQRASVRAVSPTPALLSVPDGHMRAPLAHRLSVDYSEPTSPTDPTTGFPMRPSSRASGRQSPLSPEDALGVQGRRGSSRLSGKFALPPPGSLLPVGMQSSSPSQDGDQPISPHVLDDEISPIAQRGSSRASFNEKAERRKSRSVSPANYTPSLIQLDDQASSQYRPITLAESMHREPRLSRPVSAAFDRPPSASFDRPISVHEDGRPSSAQGDRTASPMSRTRTGSRGSQRYEDSEQSPVEQRQPSRPSSAAQIRPVSAAQSRPGSASYERPASQTELRPVSQAEELPVSQMERPESKASIRSQGSLKESSPTVVEEQQPASRPASRPDSAAQSRPTSATLQPLDRPTSATLQPFDGSERSPPSQEGRPGSRASVPALNLGSMRPGSRQSKTMEPVTVPAPVPVSTTPEPEAPVERAPSRLAFEEPVAETTPEPVEEAPKPVTTPEPMFEDPDSYLDNEHFLAQMSMEDLVTAKDRLKRMVRLFKESKGTGGGEAPAVIKQAYVRYQRLSKVAEQRVTEAPATPQPTPPPAAEKSMAMSPETPEVSRVDTSAVIAAPTEITLPEETASLVSRAKELLKLAESEGKEGKESESAALRTKLKRIFGAWKKEYAKVNGKEPATSDLPRPVKEVVIYVKKLATLVGAADE